MNHADEITGRCRYEVDLAVNAAELLLKNDHRKDACTCGNVGSSFCNAVCRGHSGSCVTLGRAKRDSGFKVAFGIEESGAFCSENTCRSTGAENCGEDVPECICKTVFFEEFIKSGNHFGLVVAG